MTRPSYGYITLWKGYELVMWLWQAFNGSRNSLLGIFRVVFYGCFIKGRVKKWRSFSKELKSPKFYRHENSMNYTFFVQKSRKFFEVKMKHCIESWCIKNKIHFHVCLDCNFRLLHLSSVLWSGSWVMVNQKFFVTNIIQAGWIVNPWQDLCSEEDDLSCQKGSKNPGFES